MSTDYQRIFAALDGTDAQEAVARKAVRMASDHHAALRLAHVIDAVPTEASAVDFEELCTNFQHQIEESIKDILEQAKADENIKSVEVCVEAGSINDTLDKRLIEPFDPDLVICGERGLSSLKYMFVGSVSTHLIRSVRCDVLVVKQD
jgi:nucleotide-binding universal stress UspA family protein